MQQTCAIMAPGDDAAALEASLIENIARPDPDEVSRREPEPLRDSGFGKAVAEALQARQQRLIGMENGRVVYRTNLLSELRQTELNRVAGQLSHELGLGYVEMNSGERIDGGYHRSVDLASGKFAVIEKSREFTLVPWRPMLDITWARQYPA